MTEPAAYPVTIRAAKRFVREHHSHHPKIQGGLFGVAVAEAGRVCCVAIVGRPVARSLARDPRCIEVTREASDGTVHGAASACLRVAVAAALALGYRRLVSYTLLGETGTTYRKAGWHPAAITDGGEWDRPSRARQTALWPERKIRWEIGPDAAPRSRAARSLLWQSALAVPRG